MTELPDLGRLTPSQLEWVRGVIAQFELPHAYQRNSRSDLISVPVLGRVGDALRIHHAFSRQPLSKDRFEFAFERALALSGIAARLVKSRTNRGHDMTVNGVPISLKTEAASNIHKDFIHVSKWMELGKGVWELPLLRDAFLEHMKGYERILTLRCLSPGPRHYSYELVEIPKALMMEASQCKFEVMQNSRQNPKPGYGYVTDLNGAAKYSLYFDGGTERKLQIKKLRKDLCTSHAVWNFDSTPLE